MGTKAAYQALVTGRLVLIKNAATQLTNIGVICGPVVKQKNPLLQTANSSKGVATSSFPRHLDS